MIQKKCFVVLCLSLMIAALRRKSVAVLVAMLILSTIPFWLHVSLHVASQESLAAQAQAPPKRSIVTSLHFKNIGVAGGLAASWVQCLGQDRDGFVWIGTENGANRFDGKSFYHYRNIPFDTTSLPSGYANSIVHDSSGALWIATGKGLSRRDPHTNQWRRVLPDAASAATSPTNWVRAMLCTTDGTLWVGTRKGLYVRRASNLTFEPVRSITADIFYLLQDRFTPELLWFGTANNTLLCFNTRTHQTQSFSPALSPVLSLQVPASSGRLRLASAFPIMEMQQDAQGRLWMANDDNGLLCFHPQSGTWRQFRHNPKDPANPHAPSYARVFSVALESSRNVLWIGTWGGGLNRMDLATETITAVLKSNPQQSASLAANEVHTMLFDRENNLWVATPNGVSILTALARNSGGFTPLVPDSALQRGAESYSLSTVALETMPSASSQFAQNPATERVWIDTFNDICCYYPAQKRFDRVTLLLPAGHDAKRAHAVTSFAPDGAGAVWLGTSDGVYWAERTEARSTLEPRSAYIFRHFSGIPHINKDSFIRTMWCDAEGTLWISDDKTGLTLYRPASKTWRHIDGERPEGYVPSRPLCFAGRRNDRGEYEVWFGGWRGGLQCYNTTTKRFRNYSHDPANPRSLPVENIGAIYIPSIPPPQSRNGRELGLRREDNRNDEVWFAPVNAGLCCLKNPSEPSTQAAFERFTSDDGLPEGSIWGIVEQDEHGEHGAARARTFWCASQRGILRFSPQSRSARLYGLSYGLSSLEFLTCAKLADGQMVFGSIKDVVIFHPDSLETVLPAPCVQMIGCTILSEPRILTSEQQRGVEPLELQWWQNIVDFRFAAPAFAAQEQTRYRYRLEGFETAWHGDHAAGAASSAGNSGVEGSNRAVYSNLNAGEYTFVAQASLPDGTWNEAGAARMRLVVVPPFWRRWWFVAGASLLVLVAFAFVVRYLSTQKLRRRVALLEELGAERERISQDVHDDVGSTLTRIALLSEALRYYQTSYFQTQLQKQFQNQFQTQSQAQFQSADDEENTAQSNAAFATEQMQQRLEAIATTARDAVTSLGEIIWAIKPVNDSLENFLTYCREYAGDLFEPSEIICTVRLPERVPEVQPEMVLMPETRRNAFLVVKESLNNVLKHAQARSVRLGFSLEDSWLTVEIVDDGIGFGTDPRTDFNTSSGAVFNKNGGNGIVNMRRRVERLGGTFVMENRIENRMEGGGGTRVLARIPLR
jgi:signal transduction histidine kinase/ligand-binding sensor domain-containing protein